MGRRRILIVDDELVFRESLTGWLERDGYEVEMAAGSKEALKRLKDSRFDILIVDVKTEGDQRGGNIKTSECESSQCNGHYDDRLRLD